ncbi:hypothetical protein HN011_011066 [Eciton burchellii]|nr:hypothetical protein HN011_011066 [Eciton burchellii]
MWPIDSDNRDRELQCRCPARPACAGWRDANPWLRTMMTMTTTTRRQDVQTACLPCVHVHIDSPVVYASWRFREIPQKAWEITGANHS